jgi:hypothetical protein
MKHKHYLVWVLTIGAFVRCSAVTGSQEENELNDVELASLALGVVALSEAALPELRGSWKDANNNTFTVSLNNGTWIAYGNNVQYSFSATHTIRSYNNSVRRYFFECTAQTGFGCTVGTFGAVQWTISGNTLSMCEYHSNQSSLAAAESGDTSAVNPSNLSTGCEGFAWNNYTRQ